MQTSTTDPIHALWPKARRRILGLLLTDPDGEWHLRGIAREIDLAPATVQREVTSLHGTGILTRRRDGNRVQYSADRSCPIFPELHRIMLKTTGPANVLRDALHPVADRIDMAFLFGSLARGDATGQSDVDLMIVGAVGPRELVPMIRRATGKLRREVNPVVMEPAEFRQRIADGDHFLTRVLQDPMIFIIGDPDQLHRIAPPASPCEDRT